MIEHAEFIETDKPAPAWECGLLLLKAEYDMLQLLLEVGRDRAAQLMKQLAEMKASKTGE